MQQNKKKEYKIALYLVLLSQSSANDCQR